MRRARPRPGASAPHALALGVEESRRALSCSIVGTCGTGRLLGIPSSMFSQGSLVAAQIGWSGVDILGFPDQASDWSIRMCRYSVSLTPGCIPQRVPGTDDTVSEAWTVPRFSIQLLKGLAKLISWPSGSVRWK